VKFYSLYIFLLSWLLTSDFECEMALYSTGRTPIIAFGSTSVKFTDYYVKPVIILIASCVNSFYLWAIYPHCGTILSGSLLDLASRIIFTQILTLFTVFGMWFLNVSILSRVIPRYFGVKIMTFSYVVEFYSSLWYFWSYT